MHPAMHRCSRDIVSPVQRPQYRVQSISRKVVLAGALLALVLAAAALVENSNSARSASEKLLELRSTNEQRVSSQTSGHYFADGKIHYFKLAAPPSAYMDPSSDGATDYRSASTSGLGFAGGGDPYKYIRTGKFRSAMLE